MADNPGTNAINAVAEELGKDLYATVKRQFNYLCCFSKNIESMNEETRNLRGKREGLEIDVDAKTRNMEIIDPQVTNWLADSEAMIKTKEEIEAQIADARGSCCTNIKSRFSLGKKVKVTTEAMQNLLKKELPTPIAHPALHPASRTIQVEDIFALPSRKKIENDIVQKLSSQQEAVNVVGIAGMGGVGKTTLATVILNRLITENSFEAVKVVVSQDVDILRIQKSIGLQLGFKEAEDWKDEYYGVRQLSSRLNESKKLLIFLDDIWKELPLARLGIPKNRGCMTLLTSRNRDALNQMRAQVFEIDTLPKVEARSLFQEKAEIQMDGPYLDTDLKSTAEEIVEECDGLPLAIVIIGSALRNKEQQFWDVALRQLKRSRAISDVYDKLHMRLKVSYKLLDNEDAKLLFLLCCLYPEDHSISINDLGLYSMGLKIFNEVDSLQEARDRVYLGVDKLKNCYLLLDGKNENEVKMHDVVRDVAINIASEEEWCDNLRPKGQYHEKCKWISVCTTSSDEPLNHFFMGWSNFPDLRLLIIHHRSRWDGTIKISDISILQGMQRLKALSFTHVEFGSPPEETKWPNDLLTLQFVYCKGLKTLSFVGDLLKLKILDCNGCREIQELPVGIGGLKCLKLLNLSGCSKLQRIAPGIIKQLVELEELKMLGSFSKWESSKVKDKEGMNVPLNELESLRKLICLEIQVDDISLVHEKIDISSHLFKYKIQMSKGWIGNCRDYEKAIGLGGLPNEIINDGSWIRKLIATTAIEGLNLDGDGSGNLGNLSRTLNTLKRLKITNCWNLQNLFCIEKAKDIFIQLETLEIKECEKMKQVFISKESDEDGKTSIMTFPKLKTLVLNCLPSLTTFWKGSESSIEFPFLEELEIIGCGKFKSILCSGMESKRKIVHLFFSYKVKLGVGLKRLRICNCHKFRSLFSFSTIENLVNLEDLWLSYCDAMEDMLEREKNKDEGISPHFTFPKLKTIRLEYLPSLSCICKGIESIIFPILKELDITFCPKLKCFVSSMECSQESEEGCTGHDESFHFFCDGKVKLGGLKKLAIWNCHNITSLFSSSMVETLVSLNYLFLCDCDEMENVLRREKNKDEGKISSRVTFSKLETLILNGLSSLTNMCKGIESIILPILKRLEITSCPKLKGFISSTEYSQESKEGCTNDDEPFPCLCDTKVQFNKLEDLSMSECHVIWSIFSFLVAKNLTSLKCIKIKKCFMINKVITSEGENDMHGLTKLFPSLETLEIEEMPAWEMLWEWKCVLEFSMLKIISIVECPHFKFLTSGSLTTPKLKRMRINDLRFDKGEWKVMEEDLNRFLCQHIKATREVWKVGGDDVSKPSQLNTLLLPTQRHSLPNLAVNRLLIYNRYYEKELGVVALTSNAVHKWNWKSGKSSASILPNLSTQPSHDLNNDAKSTQHHSIASLALSKYGWFLVSVSGGIVTLFDMEYLRVIKTSMAPPPAATSVAFHPENTYMIVVGMDDSIIQIYSRKDDEVQTTLKDGHQKRISGLAVSERLNLLVSSGADAQLCVWSMRGWEKKKSRPIQAPPGHPAPLDGETRVQFHTDEYYVLVVHQTHVAIYDPELECLRMWYPRDSLPSPVSCAMYSSNGWMIYTGFYDGAVGIFDFEHLTLLCRIAPSAYISSPFPCEGNAFPKVMDIAAHPENPYQFALGLSNGAVYVIGPPDAQTKSGGLIFQKINMLPSISPSSSMESMTSSTSG